ncbi:MAG: class I SAM-dependent methyltransferase [Planctomycetota bacterium]
MESRPPLDDYRWLTGEEGNRWLRLAAEDRRPLVTVAGRLRKDLPLERAHLILDQMELRRRGRAKFVDAERMFFTRVGLEQATDQWVARYKASRFPRRETLADLCCGIGGDLLALASRGAVEGLDQDPVAVLLAEANLHALFPAAADATTASVRVGNAAEVSVGDFAAWHLDPDRRPEGHRTTDLKHYLPGLPAIERLLHGRGDAAVKLAPAAVPPERWAREAELEWIGRDGQCRQLVAWFGTLGDHRGRRRATVLCRGSGESFKVRTLIGSPDDRAPVSSQIGRYVFDPDSAVSAAALMGSLAREHQLTALGPGVAYLTGDRPLDDPALGCFEVTDVMPMDRKRLGKLLKDRNVGRLEIKKRGVPHDPEELRRRLAIRGDESAVLLLTRIGQSVTAIVAKRKKPDSTEPTMIAPL